MIFLTIMGCLIALLLYLGVGYKIADAVLEATDSFYWGVFIIIVWGIGIPLAILAQVCS